MQTGNEALSASKIPAFQFTVHFTVYAPLKKINKLRRSCSWAHSWGELLVIISGGAPKERRRSHVERRSSKRVFLESPFLLFPLKLFKCFKGKPYGGREERTLQKHPFGRPFLRTSSSPLLWRTLTFICFCPTT